jgi:hypothetical protein
VLSWLVHVFAELQLFSDGQIVDYQVFHRSLLNLDCSGTGFIGFRSRLAEVQQTRNI